MKCFLGYSLDPLIRFKSTSGGVGTALIKYMFDYGIIQTSISFKFNAETLQYIPILIHSFEDYQMCGSIYQEIDLIGFVKSHLNEIKGNFACFALPCQVRAIRAMVDSSKRRGYILGLTCSSQQTLEATKYLLHCIGVKEPEITKLQYRGNGWPSGIQIETINGKKTYVANNNSIWSDIFHSRLFIRPKCFACLDTLNKHSDISLADPWLPKYYSEVNDGMTMVIINNEEYLEEIIANAINERYIAMKSVPYDDIVQSQIATIMRKNSYKSSLKLTRIYRKLINAKLYKKIILNPVFFKWHCKIRNIVERVLRKLMK